MRGGILESVWDECRLAKGVTDGENSRVHQRRDGGWWRQNQPDRINFGEKNGEGKLGKGTSLSSELSRAPVESTDHGGSKK